MFITIDLKIFKFYEFEFSKYFYCSGELGQFWKIFLLNFSFFSKDPFCIPKFNKNIHLKNHNFRFFIQLRPINGSGVTAFEAKSDVFERRP